MPEVSIITPVYNGFMYIESAARSVLSQTYTDYEWLIVDDSSTDKTHEVLKELENQNKRISVLRMSRNRGPVHARNAALQAARGRYIAFLDIDDNWLPGKLERHIRFMKEKDAGLSYTAYRKFNNEGIITSRSLITIPDRITYRSMKKTCSIMASSAIYDTEKTGPILQDLTAVHKDDLYLWLKILKKIEYGFGLNEDLARLRIHSDSWTGNKMKEAGKQWLFYRESLNLSLPETLFYFSHYAIYGTVKFLK